MRGGKQNAVPCGKEITARGAAFTGADQLGLRRLAVRRVHGNDVHLVTGNALTLVLKDQVAIVGGEIRFGILPAECELANILQVLFARINE